MTHPGNDEGPWSAAKAAASRKEIAFTFDDVPRSPGAFLTPVERRRKLIALLDGSCIQAAFFANPGHLENPNDLALADSITDYGHAGHLLGNHGFLHPALSETAIEPFMRDVDQAAAWLEGRPNAKPWFRFPFLDEESNDLEKRDAVRTALQARRIWPAPVTIDVWDWNLEERSLQATKAGQAIDQGALMALFVGMHADAARAADRQAQILFGRSMAQVFLLHEADVTVLGLPPLIARLRADGWVLVSPGRAYEDPVYQIQPAKLPSGGPLLDALERDLGTARPMQARYEEYDESNRQFDRRVLGRRAQAESPSHL
jgi:peptidoglycan-N-acetylglucosamine deacetylase